MQGVFDRNGNRFQTKKALREAVTAGNYVKLEATSWVGDEYDGPLRDAPDGTYSIVGPDPYKIRRWYATVTVADGKAKVK